MSRAFRLRRKPNPNYHIVGDSTCSVVEQRNDPDFDYTAGPGSTLSGAGYTIEAPFAIIPLTPPEAPIVICGVSNWDQVTWFDVGTRDFSGYTTAHNYYSSFGAEVIWVEAPYLPAAFIGSPEIGGTEADHDDFNAAIAAELGVTLIPWAIRDVELQIDDLHPTVQGAQDLVDRYANLVGTKVSRLRGTSDPSTIRGVTPQKSGHAIASFTFTAAATGTRVVQGTAIAAFTFTASATGTVMFGEGQVAATSTVASSPFTTCATATSAHTDVLVGV